MFGFGFGKPSWYDDERGECFAPDPDVEYWEGMMEEDCPPLFEGCECEGYEDRANSVQWDDYKELVVWEHEFEGQYSGKLIGRYRCPDCGQKFWVYEEGPYEGFCAHEIDYVGPYEEPPKPGWDVD